MVLLFKRRDLRLLVVQLPLLEGYNSDDDEAEANNNDDAKVDEGGNTVAVVVFKVVAPNVADVSKDVDNDERRDDEVVMLVVFGIKNFSLLTKTTAPIYIRYNKIHFEISFYGVEGEGGVFFFKREQRQKEKKWEIEKNSSDIQNYV